MDGTLMMRMLFNDFFEQQLRQTVRRLRSRKGQRLHSSMRAEVTDLYTSPTQPAPVQVDETCWSIPWSGGYLVDSTGHLVKKSEAGNLFRIDWQTLQGEEVVKLFGLLRAMELMT